MKEDMFHVFNTKFTLVSLIYTMIAMFVLWLQNAANYASQLPDTTLAGLGLAVAFIGGVMSYLWEKKQSKKASLRTSCIFAMGVGVIVGLLSYHQLIMVRNQPTYWLGLIAVAGFANQICLGLVSIILRRKAKEIFHLEETHNDENNEITGRREGQGTKLEADKGENLVL